MLAADVLICLVPPENCNTKWENCEESITGNVPLIQENCAKIAPMLSSTSLIMTNDNCLFCLFLTRFGHKYVARLLDECFYLLSYYYHANVKWTAILYMFTANYRFASSLHKAIIVAQIGT